MEYNLERLKAHILPLSKAEHCGAAKKEWELIGVEVSEEFDNRPCSKEIKEHCYIRNKINGKTSYVSNVCINRFMGINTGNLFSGLKRIVKNPAANANEDLILHARKLGYIFDKEFTFLMDTRFKPKLSQKQAEWREKINLRITRKIVVQRRSRS